MPKLLVVDDSALMRKFFRDLFAEESGYQLEFARNGREALEQLHAFQPDVITLDINMPEMDGLTALSEIMVQRPTPTLMVSSLSQRDALITLEALALGAVDYVGKPGGTISLGMADIAADLKSKVRTASRSRIRTRLQATRPPEPTPSPVGRPPARRTATAGLAARLSEEHAAIQASAASVARHLQDPGGVVIIGVSTGGPRALEEVLPSLPANLPWPVVVIQHMPALFTGAFAQRLDQYCALTVQEVTTNTALEAGNVYIARGGADAILARRAGRLCMSPRPEDPAQFWHPSVALMMESAMRVLEPAQLIGVMLTGMGNDGADAMAALKQAGGRTVAESEETAVVFGMPGELVRRGGATKIAPIDQVALQINRWLGVRTPT